MPDNQYDAVLIGQILAIHNREVLAVAGYDDFRRYLTQEDVTRIATKASLPNLPADLQIFVTATPEEGRVHQRILREKYRDSGLQRQIPPFPLPNEFSEAEDDEVDLPTERANYQRVVSPDARKLGVVLYFDKDNQRGLVVPVEQAPDFDRERIEEVKLTFQFKEGEPVSDLRRMDMVSYYQKSGKAKSVSSQFIGILTGYKDGYGVLRGRFGSHIIQGQGTSFVVGQPVVFNALYDSEENYYKAFNCKSLVGLNVLDSVSEEVATLNYYLFKNADLAPVFVEKIIVSPETTEALLHYRISIAFPILNDQGIVSPIIPVWEEHTKAIAKATSKSADWHETIAVLVKLLNDIRSKLPEWIADETNKQTLLDHCFWMPLQRVQGLNKEQTIDFSLATYQVIHRIWPEATCPDWHLNNIKNSLERWCANSLISNQAEEKQALNRIIEATSLLHSSTDSFVKLVQLSPDYQLTKWLEEPHRVEFPVPQEPDKLAGLIANVPADRVGQALNLIPSPNLETVYPLLTESTVRKLVVAVLLERYIDALNPLVFDLETTDTRQIREGYFEMGEVEGYVKPVDNNGLNSFVNKFQRAVGQTALLAGHNIRAFDMPILVNRGVDFGQTPVWDTLEVEALIAPLSPSFALVTAHDARTDVAKTTKLFRNQLKRIVAEWLIYAPVLWPIIPESISHWCETFSTTYLNDLTAPDPAERQAFFREPVRASPVDFQALPADAPVLLVVPRLLWPRYSGLPNVQFIRTETPGPDDEPDPYLLWLDADRIQEIIKPRFIQQLLLAYVTTCQRKQIAPTVANLPVWTRKQLQQELADIQVVCQPAPALPAELVPETYVTDELGLLNLDPSVVTLLHVHHTDPLLSAVLAKKRLGQVHLMNQASFLADFPVWTRLVGGNRFAPLPKKLLDGITELEPPGPLLNNFWLEKTDATMFTVWGNVARPDNDDVLLAEKPPESNVPNGSLSLVYTGGKSGAHYRLNPESLYRDAYWTGQLYVLQQLDFHIPTVLVIQNRSEVEPLTAWFTSKGYACPPPGRTLNRQLEMLHGSGRKKAVLVIPVDRLPALMESNTEGPLRVVLDGLPLAELTAMFDYINHDKKTDADEDAADDRLDPLEAPISETPEGDTETVPDEDNGASTKKKKARVSAGVTLRLVAPLMRHYREMFYQNNPDNEFIILDSRLNDHPDLPSRWNATPIKCQLWQDNDQYARLRDELSRHFPSPAHVDFSLTDLVTAQQTIERVFLGQNEQGVWNELRKNQQPYFNKIIQPTGDLIVSLPTGGGKSVLFQGPALYRGSLTNRLTLVITPLRALMEDQVDNLNGLGFFGCVEFINQDSGNVQDIYRRIAGGEITMVYVTPERFRSRSFDLALKTRIERDGGLEYCVFDEAHCISQWGSEFRPDYLWVASLMSRLKKANGNFPALFFSATVSEQIYNDLNDIFSDRTASHAESAGV